ncbi:hypothetical protein TcCL_Unassigned03569 [Trypanosoma cruzi]|nr:hypothetical protein TcCL_Unassigned03569 [Trypanosoma cruzi]
MRRARLAATHAHSRTHILSHNLPTHKRAKTWRRKARRTTHAEATPSTSHRKIVPCAPHIHGGKERDRAHTTPQHCAVLLPSPTDWNYAPQQVVVDWRPTLTVRHGAHSPLSSDCTQQAGAQSPSCHRNGEQKQSSSRIIDASSRKKEKACQQHGQQWGTQRDAETLSDSEHSKNKEMNRSDLPKTKEKMVRVQKNSQTT